MTVTSAKRTAGPYIGNGVSTQFLIDYRFLDNSHITVTKQQGHSETTLSEGYDYTLQGAGQNNGQLTLFTPLETGAKLSITRVVPLTQLAQYVQGDAFAAQSHENALDKLTMIVQQQQGELDTKIQIPQGSLDGKILGFDEQSQPKPLTISNGLIQQKDLIQVKPGTAILVNALGVHVLYGDGLGIYDSALSVQLGTGLDFDENKKIKIRDWLMQLIQETSNGLTDLQGLINNLVQRIAALEGGTQVAITFGNGLSVNTEGKVVVRPHLGIKVDDNGVSVKLGDGLEFDGNNNVKISDAMQTKIAGKADKVDIASEEDIANGTAGKVVDAAGLASALSVGGGFSVFQSGPVFVGLGARVKLTGFASPVFDTHKAFSSGRFTAAFPGVYLFEVYAATKQTWGNYTADAVSILFYKNGAVYRELAEYASTFSDGRTTIQKVLLIQLAKDDYIEFGLSHYFATGGADFNYSVSGTHLA